MNEKEFRHYAEAYGAQIERWPPEVRAAATALRETPWAREVLAEAAQFDALFDALPAEIAPGRVGAGIAAVNARITRERSSWRSFWRPFAWQWAGVATAGVLGVFVAVVTTGPTYSDATAMSQLFALTLSFSDSALVTNLGDLS